VTVLGEEKESKTYCVTLTQSTLVSFSLLNIAKT